MSLVTQAAARGRDPLRASAAKPMRAPLSTGAVLVGVIGSACLTALLVVAALNLELRYFDGGTMIWLAAGPAAAAALVASCLFALARRRPQFVAPALVSVGMSFAWVAFGGVLVGILSAYFSMFPNPA